jgi:hypothetical protein
MATMADIEPLLHLCRTMHAECALHGAFSETKMRGVLEALLGKQAGVVGVIDDVAEDGTSYIVAMVALEWVQPYYTEDWQWNDRFIYVRESHRSAQAWADLSMFARWFVDQVSPPGCEIPVPLLIGFCQPPAKAKVLTRLFGRQFVQVGAIFAYGNTSRHGRIEAV